ncbi:MAG: hypothetical protein ABIS01_17050 [Ferruginibacter sp.]
MKIVLFLLCIAFAGCGAKTNDEIAKDLIKEKLKTSLPDFKDYEPVNFSALGTAFLPYEETSQYIASSKSLKEYRDSVTMLEKIIGENKSSSAIVNSYKKTLEQLQDSINAKNDRKNRDKQGYTPEKLFKMSHAYTIKDKAGLDKKTEDEFYFDKDLKTVVKVNKQH